MRLLPIPEHYKVGALALLVGLILAMTVPLDFLPGACLIPHLKGPLEWWEIAPGRKVLRFREPSKQATVEWRHSGVSEDMIAANLVSIPDYACESLGRGAVYSIARLLGWDMAQRPAEYYPMSNREAWTYTGYNPRTKSINTSFELKPTPIIRKRPFYRKYESTQDLPPIAYLRMSPERASLILKHPVPGASIDEATSIFWEEIFESNKTVVITEGAKKAASLISHGYVAISVPGACGGFTRGTLTLRDDLTPLLRRARTIIIAFDNDRAPSTRQLVSAFKYYMGRSLQAEGMKVLVVTPYGEDKGIDDFIVSRGQTPLDVLMSQAMPFADWAQTLRQTANIGSPKDLVHCGAPSGKVRAPAPPDTQ